MIIANLQWISYKIDAMEQYLTEFESIVQKREHFADSIYEGCAYDKLSEVSFSFGNIKQPYW